MARNKFGGMGGGNAGGMGNMQAMIKQAQKMQEDMLRTQEQIAQMETEATAGGGAVRAVIIGTNQFKSIEIKPDVVDADDIEMLQDLVMVAVNEALRLAHEKSDESMRGVTGGMNLPGMSSLY